MLPKTKEPIKPSEYTGSMYRDNWHLSLLQFREDIKSSLDKKEKEDQDYFNQKLKYYN